MNSREVVFAITTLLLTVSVGSISSLPIEAPANIVSVFRITDSSDTRITDGGDNRIID